MQRDIIKERQTKRSAVLLCLLLKEAVFLKHAFTKLVEVSLIGIAELEGWDEESIVARAGSSLPCGSERRHLKGKISVVAYIYKSVDHRIKIEASEKWGQVESLSPRLS